MPESISMDVGDLIIFNSMGDGSCQSRFAVKERRRQLNVACKRHAARDKRPPQRATVLISATTDLSSNALSITPIVNAANQLIL